MPPLDWCGNSMVNHCVDHLKQLNISILSSKVAADPRILIFDKFDKTWLDFIARESEAAQFVIFPTHRKTWAIRSVPKKGQKFEYCKLLPAEWGGRQKDFADISDVQDALYCHNGCFLAEANSLEGADKLAVIALEH